jgi:hypothetical protein
MRRPIAGTLALLVLLAGCGGDDSTSTDTTVESGVLASAKVEKARACLQEQGFQIAGGVSDPVNEDSPDAELIVNVGQDQVFVAYYRDSEAAAGAESRVRANIGPEGFVEREGAVTVIWGTKPDAADREAVARCAFA